MLEPIDAWQTLVLRGQVVIIEVDGFGLEFRQAVGEVCRPIPQARQLWVALGLAFKGDSNGVEPLAEQAD